MPRQGWTKLTPAELDARGFSPSSERYRSPDGDVVSRRQYDNARYSDAGWRNRADFERRHDDPTYRHFQDVATRNLGLTRRQVDSPDGPFARHALKARAAGWGKGRAGRSAKGPMARFLVWLGMRDPTADYPVGGSP